MQFSPLDSMFEKQTQNTTFFCFWINSFNMIIFFTHFSKNLDGLIQPHSTSQPVNQFWSVFLADLKLTMYTWAGLKSREISLPLPLSAGIKGVDHH